MTIEDTIPQGGREPGRDTSRQDEPRRSEPREEPSRGPRAITDADRAANPIGVAKREREQRERDDAGRFANKGKDHPQQKPEGQEDGDKPDDGQQGDRQQQNGQVPTGALKAERDKRQGAERDLENLRREMAEMRGMMMGRQNAGPQQQPQPETPPEFWQDPNAAMEYRLKQSLSPMERQLQEQRLGFSRMMAMQAHGPEKVDGAVQALAQLRHSNPAEYQRLEAMAERSMDPVGDVVRWHTQASALQRYGSDPEAYIKAEIERRMAETQQHGGDDHQHHYQQPSPAATRQPVQQQPLPSSFAAQRGGGPRGGPAYGGPKSLSDMMGR